MSKLSFSYFLSLFPAVELPVQLTADSHHLFSQNNDPLPPAAVQQFIRPTEEDAPDDEFTEYVPCFLVPSPEEFFAIVYWRAGLLDYRYVLATYTKQGISIDSRIIAGTFSDGQRVTHSVASIDEELAIVTVSGEALDADAPYDPAASRITEVELLPDGQIG